MSSVKCRICEGHIVLASLPGSTARRYQENNAGFCSPKCRRTYRQRVIRARRTQLPPAMCHVCGRRIDEAAVGRRTLMAQLRRGRGFCSRECSGVFNSRISSVRIRETRERYVGEWGAWTRGSKLSPARRKHLSKKLKEIGHRPKVRGGNGRPTPVAQQMLADALGWETEHIVRTGRPRRPGLPTHYKIDIANPVRRIAVEVDGMSHRAVSRQEQDTKKDRFLAGNGWTVLRFSNQQVMDDLEACVRTVLSTTSRST